MNKEAILIIGCMERYRFYKQLSGHEVEELFAHYKLYEYITYFYETISSMGTHCIIRDLDNYINIHTG